MPKVTVLIPVYNTEVYLKECIQSVINQTLQDIEIICINDGSSDNSLEILNNFAQLDKRIKILSQKHQGGGKARNAGLKFAQGEYLAFLDSDDFYDENFCEKMYNKAVGTDSDVVVCAARNYNVLNNEYGKMPWSLGEEYLPAKEVFNYKDMRKYIFQFSQNWNWNKLFKKKFIDTNNITFQNIFRTNDLLFTCKSLVLAKKISVIKDELVTYRIGTINNCQSTNYKYPFDFYKAFKELKKYLISISKYEELKISYINWSLGGLVYNIDSVKNNSVQNKMGKYLYNRGLGFLGLNSFNCEDIFKQQDYEKFIKQYYKFKKKLFGFEYSKLHYFVYVFGLQILIKRRNKNG